MSGINNPIPVSIDDEHQISTIATDNGEADRPSSQTDESKQSPNTNYTDHLNIAKYLNHNSYATKKTLAQGMLDLALLASNSAQLKYLLTVGDSHEFYTLLLPLVIVSICLQVLQVVICLILGLILDINNVDEQRSADICNNVGVAIVSVIVVINIVITAFNLK